MPAPRRRPSPAVRPVPGHPVLLVEASPPFLVLSDLHLGLAITEKGARPDRGRAAALAAEVVEVAERTGARRVVIAGDVKDAIAGAPRVVRAEIVDFFERLRDRGLGCEVVLGNHDAGLAKLLPPEVLVHPPGGLLREGIGIFHGHAWPSRSLLLRSRTLVVGHLHPGFRLAPSPERSSTGKERCWVRCDLRPLTAKERRRRRKHPLPRASTFLVLPAFNPLCANEALNRERPGRGRRFLMQRFLTRGTSRAYLLDGTDLGELRW